MRAAVYVLMLLFAVSARPVWAEDSTDYRVVATNKTSTMQKEMNEAADAGFQFGAIMGGDTSFGGSEVVVIMSKTANAGPRYEYRLLATNKTSTMQKEMQERATRATSSKVRPFSKARSAVKRLSSSSSAISRQLRLVASSTG